MKKSRINEPWDSGTYGFTQQRKQPSFEDKVIKNTYITYSSRHVKLKPGL